MQVLGKRKMQEFFRLESVKKKDDLGELVVDGKIILNWMLKE